MENTPHTTKPAEPAPSDLEAIEGFKNFLVQAVTGVDMAIYRSQLQSESPESAGSAVSRQLKLVLIARYLNGCYKSLIKKDDDYVVGLFESLPHAPVCLMHIAMSVCQGLMITSDSFQIASASGTGPESIGPRRDLLTELYTRVINAMPMERFFSHTCIGKMDLSGEDPESELFILKPTAPTT